MSEPIIARQVKTGVPVDIGTANEEGTSEALARADHVHAGGGVGTVDLLLDDVNMDILIDTVAGYVLVNL